MSDNYIELGRTFRELSIESGGGDEFDEKQLRYGVSLNWEDLLTGYRTILLSEAGTGKTAETRHAAQKLRALGKSAFFLRLEYVESGLHDAFEVGNLAEFERWLTSNEQAWLFLDSVDESRLRCPADFERAIRIIGNRMSTALARTHIVITSRGAAWRPLTDLSLCERHLKYTQSAESGTAFRIVSLDDLRPPQVEIFAQSRGIADTRPFIDAIARADAWEMAARPDDLTELAEFWSRNGRIGNRLELIRASVDRRLAERDQNRADRFPLSPSDARIGAQRIAAAATMAKQSTIRVPDGNQNTRGLDVASILPDWDNAKRAALLTRPIFDEAIYQTVRFYHRTVREFLAAEWFKELLGRQTSRRRIEAVFFREQYGEKVIVPATRPVLVWLILLDDGIRDRALAISPELAFEGGEPKALPLPVRQKVLHQICETMNVDAIRNPAADDRAIRRFADKDLAADVKELLARYAANSELQWFLLKLVAHGELKEALPEVRQLALNPDAGHYARSAAFQALYAVGSERDKEAVRASFLAEAETLNVDWLVVLMDSLPSTRESVQWILASVIKIDSAARLTHLKRAINLFVDGLDLELVAMLLEGLDALLLDHSVAGNSYQAVSQKHGWLTWNALQAAERLVLSQHSAALKSFTLSILHHLPLVADDSDLRFGRTGPTLSISVPTWPVLNDALFWYAVGEARKRSARQNERIVDMSRMRCLYCRFESGDFERVLGAVEERELIDDRLVALSLAFRLYVDAQRPIEWLAAMKSKTAGFPELESALKEHLYPSPPSSDQKRLDRQIEANRRKQLKTDALNAQRQLEWKRHLAEHVEKLRNPGLADGTEILCMQWYLHEKLRDHDPPSSHWAFGNWEALAEEFGPDVARAFRDGMVDYWRRYTPALPSEGQTDGSAPHQAIFGLTGITIEARETENWPHGFNDLEADLAFRYAMHELNGVPAWLPALFDAFPDLVTRRLLQEIDHDLGIEQADVDPRGTLHDLNWGGLWTCAGIGQGIFERLQVLAPKNVRNLRYMLNIIHGADIDQDALARLAETRSADPRIDHAGCWFAVWTGIDPARAIPALTGRLERTENAVDQAQLAMTFITSLLGSFGTELETGDAFRTAEHLAVLYGLMHRYIREKDDIRHVGRDSYSPGLRDHAQDARNRLLSLLLDIPGKESYLALMDLARLHPEPAARPWMAHHARAKAELDADLTPWSIAQTREFQDEMERTPANPRELFELACMRFLDLKDNLEHGDSSIADILCKGATLETDMRKYIGDWCRERAQVRYAVTQEEELADGKKLDLRFWGHGFDGPLPVELKLADKWTGPELLERLENQLCGDYLRDSRSGYGLFVLVYRGEKKRWALPETPEAIDFEGLVAALEARWNEISGRFPNIQDIRVIGIDLTRRRNG